MRPDVKAKIAQNSELRSLPEIEAMQPVKIRRTRRKLDLIAAKKVVLKKVDANKSN